MFFHAQDITFDCKPYSLSEHMTARAWHKMLLFNVWIICIFDRSIIINHPTNGPFSIAILNNQRASAMSMMVPANAAP